MSDSVISVDITDKEIHFATLTESVRSVQAGAVVLFLGTVREFTNGRQTVSLEYDAYTEMARRKMDEIANAACSRWPLTGLAIEHRLGRLNLGEISVAVAVSSAHRKDAFEAGQYVIDTLKETVPIWKKELWADGTTEWVHPQSDHPSSSSDHQ